MRTLQRNKRLFWLCKRIKGKSPIKFEQPISMCEDYQPTNSGLDLLGLGENAILNLRIKCSVEDAYKFDIEDRCYVYVRPPSNYDPLCKDADFKVSSPPLITNNQAEIHLQRLSRKES